jgi:hypothetical protein
MLKFDSGKRATANKTNWNSLIPCAVLRLLPLSNLWMINLKMSSSPLGKLVRRSRNSYGEQPFSAYSSSSFKTRCTHKNTP